MPLYSNTASELIERVARKLSDWKDGTCTGGSTSTFVDNKREEADNYFQNTVPPSKVHIISTTDGAAPQGETRQISAWTQSTGTGTVLVNFTVTTGSGDTYCIQSLYTWDEILHAINEAIDSIKSSAFIEMLDESTRLATDAYEYEVPDGFAYVYRVSMDNGDGDFPEEIPPDQYKIIRGATNPKIHFIRYPDEQLYSDHYVGELWADNDITDGRVLRVEGLGYQDNLSLSTDICYLNPTYIVNQAAAIVLGQHITRSDTDPDSMQNRMIIYQGLANAEKPTASVMFPPNTKRVY